ncbi:hypothetical protein RZS08_28785, partial [Arthrospira platensis SPKY1]|nr:hypothetical protein [Arthrospira platensis SPKY1]
MYYLMIDGWAGDICDYTIEVVQGLSSDPPVIPGSISGPTNVCIGASATYSVPAGTGVTDYNWTLSSAIGAVANNGSDTAAITFTAPGTGELCVTPSNPCGPGAPVCKTIVSTLIPPTFQNVTFCLGDIWVCGQDT